MLTELEKQYAYNLCGTEREIPQESDSDFWLYIRKKIQNVAYHEAGHFVGKGFTDLELSHVLCISIVPYKTTFGCVKSERPVTECILADYPASIVPPNGKMLLLYLLAGYGTGVIMGNGRGEQFETIYEYCQEDGVIFDEEGSDYERASRIAEIMAKPHMPARSILSLADKWTLEMLRIPAVWNAIKIVADKLIEQGEIDRGEALGMACDHLAIPSILSLKKWKRRIHGKNM